MTSALMPGGFQVRLKASRLRMASRGPAYVGRYILGDKYQIPPHVKLINDAFVKAATEGNQRVILSMPPRHSKSETCSVFGSISFLKSAPHKRFAVASYGVSLPRGFGRRARNYLTEHGEDLGVMLAADSREAHDWKTTAGGGFLGVGVGGGFTGKGADLLVIDDPFKDAKEAFSPTIRNNVWDWWQSVASTRLEPGASVFVVMTRWHHDDLAGRLIKEGKDNGNPWTEIVLEALCEREDDPLGRAIDEPLWPERYDFAHLDQRRKSGDWSWFALYQQHPLSNAGSSPITMDDLPSWANDAYPDYRELAIHQSWDPSFEGHDPNLALKAKQSKKSKTGGVTLGFKGGRCYVLDIDCESRNFVSQQGAMRDMRAKWPATIKTYLEFKANGAALASQLGIDIPGIVPVRPAESKFLRLCAVAPFFKAGNILFPPEDSAPWVRGLKTRLCNFPNVEYDDDIDALTQGIAGEWLHDIDPKAADDAAAGHSLKTLLASY